METLGNDLVLLSIRSNGVIGTAAKLGFGLSGSELVRLTALGRVEVEVEGGQIVIHDEAPTGDVLLDEALKSMHGGLLAQYWIARRGDATRPYLERLVSAGTISLDRRKALGLVSVAGWTVVDAGRLAAARARLDAVAYGSDSADSEQVALAGLATAIGLPPLVYPGLAGWSARRRVARAGRDSGSPANLTAAPRTANTTAVWSAVNGVSHAVASAAAGAAHHAADHGGHSGGGHH